MTLLQEAASTIATNGRNEVIREATISAYVDAPENSYTPCTEFNCGAALRKMSGYMDTHDDISEFYHCKGVDNNGRFVNVENCVLKQHFNNGTGRDGL